MSVRTRAALFAEFRRGSGPAGEAAHGPILHGEVREHLGSVLGSADPRWQALFDSPVQAVACALAVQRRLCEHNRSCSEPEKVSAKMSLHEGAFEPGEGGVAGPETPLLASLLEAAPCGRVWTTRKVYAKALGRHPCAFIPLGLEYFKGLPEPIEVFEAAPALEIDPDAPLPGADAAAATESSAPPARPAARTAPPSRPSAAPEPEPSGGLGTAVAAASTLAAAWVLYAARKPLGSALSVLDLPNTIFHLAGHTLFSLTGSNTLSSAGGLLVLAAMPAALLLHFLLAERPLGVLAGLFWLGQVVLSCGRALTLGRLDPDSFAGCVQNDLQALLAAAGLQGVSFSAGRTAVFLGCLLLAFALVRGILRITQGERHGG